MAIIAVLLLWLYPLPVQDKANAGEGFYRGVIKSVVSEKPTDNGTLQLVLVEVREGNYRGQQVYAENEYSASTYGSFLVQPGQRVLLYIVANENRVTNAYVQDLDRISGMSTVALAFVVVVLLVALGKGFNAILGLLFTGLFLWRVAVPLISIGFNPVLVSIATVAASTAVTMWLVLDAWPKVLVSTVGTVGGVLASFVFGAWASNVASVTGITSEVFSFFQFSALKVDPLKLFWGAIMIAALGATMDVAVSIASAAHEIKSHHPEITFSALLSSLLQIGRDVIGTMVNTIILAYAGAELGLLAFLYASGPEMAFKYVTGQFFVSDVVRALAASTGLILAIPLTGLTAAFYYGRHGRVN